MKQTLTQKLRSWLSAAFTTRTNTAGTAGSGAATISWLKISGQAFVLLALVAGVVAVVMTHKSVNLTVNGKTTSVQTFGSSVKDVLGAAHMELAADDDVKPGVNNTVSNGSTVVVNTSREVTLMVDGTKRIVRTTASSGSALLSQLGLNQNSLVNGNGNEFSVTTPKKVNLIADGQAQSITTSASTVSGALNDAHVTLSGRDFASAPMESPVVANMVLRVSRVSMSDEHQDVDVPFDTKQKVDPERFKDEKSVTTQGVVGKTHKDFRVVKVDGAEVSRVLLGENEVSKPVAEEVTVGGKDRPKPEKEHKDSDGGNTGAAAPATANAGMWDRIAMCESTGDWHINTGNGYYGGLQFSASTWLSAGGGKYAPRADLATREQQIDIANGLYAKSGLSSWGCAGAAG